MTNISKTAILEATRLTRSGDVSGATSALRTMLGGEAGAHAPNASPIAPAFPNARGLLSGARPQAVVHTMPAQTGQFLTESYVAREGQRAYKLYVPTHSSSEPRPLILMLHGCTQSADDFAVGTRMNEIAEEQGCFVAYPIQPASANPSKCWNWFKPGDQHRDGGEPALLAGIVQHIAARYPIDRRRIYAAGLSAGGAAAAILGAEYPDLFAAIGIHSGLACGVAHDLPSAFAAMRGTGPDGSRSDASDRRGKRTPTIVFHGDRDTTVHPSNADRILSRERIAGLSRTDNRGRVPGGHAYTRTSYANGAGKALLEQWVVHGAAHAWSGGSAAGTYTDPSGPDASKEMVRFFLEHHG